MILNTVFIILFCTLISADAFNSRGIIARLPSSVSSATPQSSLHPIITIRYKDNRMRIPTKPNSSSRVTNCFSKSINLDTEDTRNNRSKRKYPSLSFVFNQILISKKQWNDKAIYSMKILKEKALKYLRTVLLYLYNTVRKLSYIVEQSLSDEYSSNNNNNEQHENKAMGFEEFNIEEHLTSEGGSNGSFDPEKMARCPFASILNFPIEQTNNATSLLSDISLEENVVMSNDSGLSE